VSLKRRFSGAPHQFEQTSFVATPSARGACALRARAECSFNADGAPSMLVCFDAESGAAVWRQKLRIADHAIEGASDSHFVELV